MNYNVTRTDRIMLIGEQLINTCLCLDENGFQNLYLMNNKRDIYNNRRYTKIRYIYNGDSKLHFPHHFFKTIITMNSENLDTLKQFVDKGGIILETRKTSFEENLNSQNYMKDKNDELESTFKKRTLSESLFYKVTYVSDFQPPTKSLPPVDILCYSSQADGIFIHSTVLRDRLKIECGVDSKLVQSSARSYAPVVILEYHPSLSMTHPVAEDVSELLSQGRKVVLENHGTLGEIRKKIAAISNSNLTVTYRSAEIAEIDGTSDYKLVPLVSYRNISLVKSKNVGNIKVGTFGFAGKQKGITDIISLCLKLEIPATVLLGMDPSNQISKVAVKKVVDKYKRNRRIKIVEEGKIIKESKNGLIQILVGNHSDAEIAEQMLNCSHIAFAHRTRMEQSGTINYAKRLCKPIFALDSFQSRIGQVFRFSKFTNLTPFRLIFENVVEEGLSVFRGKNELSKSLLHISRVFASQLKALLKHDSPNINSFMTMSSEDIRDEDGLNYIIEILKDLEVPSIQ